MELEGSRYSFDGYSYKGLSLEGIRINRRDGTLTKREILVGRGLPRS